MNCLLETVASIWMLTVRATPISRADDEVAEEGVQDNLEGCRNSLEAREADLAEGCRRLGREALRRRQAGDIAGAKSKIMERRRALKRLERLRTSLALVDAQLDALRTTELDKELMQTLLASSAALKKAGVGKGVEEAEAVMSELDEQLRQSGELTSVLAGGLPDSMNEGEFDVDEEFEQIERECELSSGMATAAGIGVSGPSPSGVGAIGLSPSGVGASRLSPSAVSLAVGPSSAAPTVSTPSRRNSEVDAALRASLDDAPSLPAERNRSYMVYN